MKKWCLRKLDMDDVVAETPIQKLPRDFVGTGSQCKEYAERMGCIWKDNPKMLFGGYWHRPARSENDMGYCLYPDTYDE